MPIIHYTQSMIGVNVQVRLFNNVTGHSIFFLVLQTLRRDCVQSLTCLSLNKASKGVLGIQGICHFTSMDMGYYLFSFRDMVFCLLSGLLGI